MSRRSILVLLPHGDGGCVPDQEPWEPRAGRPVAIKNKSGHTQDISNITNDCLITRNNRFKKKIGKLRNNKTWLGFAGEKGVKGEYSYNDGDPSPEAGVRNGHIDPS